MKKILMMVIVAMMATMNIQAQNIPANMRIEVAESERDKSEYSIFLYKDNDETFGYYLGLGKVLHLVPLVRDDITDLSIDNIKETCIWLGATYDEAYAKLESILELFDQDLETTVEFQGRAVARGERLGEPTTSTCIVKSKLLGGKQLLFAFTYGKHQAETYLTKTVVKELRTGMKIDKKLHPKQHR